MSVRILVVEDRPEIQTLFRAVIERLGHEVVLCDDVRSATAMLECRPAIVLSDLNLPDGSGLELAKIIRAKSGLEQTPIIIITAHPDAQPRIEATGLQGIALLTKPFRFKQLMMALERSLTDIAARQGPC